jgi:23S rRNA (pseudouridine1915-N3)-methyltransferase
MVRIKIVAVGKVREKYLSDAIAEYGKRLGRFCALEIAEVGESKNLREGDPALVGRQLAAEAAAIMARIGSGAYLIATDVQGEAPDSAGFARKLGGLIGQAPEIAFAIGGSHGLHEDVRRMAGYRLSMSRLTFPHQLARLILMEQLYRAFKILGNEKYHK